MSQEAIVSSVRSPATVHGVHGAAGLSYWKCFARGSVLHSELEAWEYAALAPGAANGEHLHSRTDEVYFFIGGAGVVVLDGEERPVGPGDVVLTPLGCRHALRNTGPGLLEWITLEMTHPETTQLLPAWSATGVTEGEER